FEVRRGHRSLSGSRVRRRRPSLGGCGFRRRRPCQGHVANRAGGGPWSGEPLQGTFSRGKPRIRHRAQGDAGAWAKAKGSRLVGAGRASCAHQLMTVTLLLNDTRKRKTKLIIATDPQ